MARYDNTFTSYETSTKLCPASLADRLIKKLDIASTDAFDKGKYAGKSYIEVIKEDPKYIRWLLKECTVQAMKDDVENIILILKDM